MKSNIQNPLLIPEILRKVLQYVDYDTLKSSRLVASVWNAQAGRILPSTCCVDLSRRCCEDHHEEHAKQITNLQQTLDTSPDPAKFFVRLRLYDKWFPGEELFQLLKTYGKYVKAFRYTFEHESCTEDGGAFCQLLIYRILSEWCPFLEELSLIYTSVGGRSIIYPIESLDFKCPINLRSIKFEVGSEIPERFQDFIVQIVANSTKLKILKICRDYEQKNNRMYEKLSALRKITKNLHEFVWDADMDHNYDSINLVNTFRFSKKLKTLSIYKAHLDSKSFPLMLNSIGPSLKKLEFVDSTCNEDHDAYQEFLPEVFEIVIKTLVNLETLSISFFDTAYDYFFSNADNLVALPHENLRHLLLSWCSEFNLSEISSVSTIVRWFPNLTLLSLCLGDEKDLHTTGVGIRLPEVVGILSGLPRLKDLCLRVCSNTAPGELQKTLKALKQIPQLLCCTLVELVRGSKCTCKCKGCKWVKITHTLTTGLKRSLKGVRFLNTIRLVGFKFNRKKRILNYAKKTGINLELYKGFPSDFDKCFERNVWAMSTAGAIQTEDFL